MAHASYDAQPFLCASAASAVRSVLLHSTLQHSVRALWCAVRDSSGYAPCTITIRHQPTLLPAISIYLVGHNQILFLKTSASCARLRHAATHITCNMHTTTTHINVITPHIHLHDTRSRFFFLF